MLSAVAARKAAKAAAETSATPPPPSSPSPVTTSENKQAPKRRTHVSGHAGPSKHKKVKVFHAPAKRDKDARYFDQGDTSNARIGTKLDGSATRIEVSSESDSSSEEELGIGLDIPPPFGPSSITVTKSQRAWSPSRPVAADSSDDGEPGPFDSFDSASHLSPTPKKQESSPLSAFRPMFNHNVYMVPDNEYVTTGEAVVLVLQPNETLMLVGTYSLCVLQGGLSLLGVTLSPSNTKHIVFAHWSSPIPILSWATPDCKGCCTFPIPQAIRQEASVTAILIGYAHTGVEGLGRICRVFENAFKPPRGSYTLPGIEPPRIHIVDSATKDIHPFVLPASWKTALASMDEHPETSMVPVCLVRGPKKSGKSSFARTLVNRLLNRYRRVAFLECDLGQSEFTPGGQVALNLVENYIFGPPFTHPSLPYRAHYIGSASPRTSPSHYLHSIRSLLESYKLDLQFLIPIDEPLPGDERIHDAIPLVVNTMGWTKGLGADLNARIEEFIDATHTFNINGDKEQGCPAPAQSQHVPQFSTAQPFMQASVRRSIEVEAIQPKITNTYQTATDHRYLNILSYFHAVFPELPASSLSGSVLKQITATSWDTSVPLCARYPYEVDSTQAFDRVYLTGPGYEDVVPSELSRVLNGAIVGLVSSGPSDNFSLPIQSTSQSFLPYTPAEPPPDPAYSMCHGLALIRGIPLTLNPCPSHMHILTPLPTVLLTQTRLLVKGDMELPIWGMLDFRDDKEGWVAGVEKDQVPYLQWGRGEGIGSEKRRARRNLMRRGQM